MSVQVTLCIRCLNRKINIWPVFHIQKIDITHTALILNRQGSKMWPITLKEFYPFVKFDSVTLWSERLNYIDWDSENCPRIGMFRLTNPRHTALVLLFTWSTRKNGWRIIFPFIMWFLIQELDCHPLSSFLKKSRMKNSLCMVCLWCFYTNPYRLVQISRWPLLSSINCYIMTFDIKAIFCGLGLRVGLYSCHLCIQT